MELKYNVSIPEGGNRRPKYAPIIEEFLASNKKVAGIEFSNKNDAYAKRNCFDACIRKKGYPCKTYLRLNWIYLERTDIDE